MNQYPPLYKDSICEKCLGCSKLSNINFRSIKPTVNKNRIPCDNFRSGYSEVELERKEAESKGNTNYYGSMYGNNN